MTTENSQVFLYNDKPVTFQLEEGATMINATELAKPFGKRPNDWIRTKAAKRYISAVSTVTQICVTDLIKQIQGGNDEQGTWLNKDIAIEFARWLDPFFGVWCNYHIQELIKQGYTISEEFKKQVGEQLHTIYKAMEDLQKNYKAVLARNEELESIIKKQADEPKRLVRRTYQRTYTITAIARELGILPEELNDHLRRNWVQHKIDGFWELKPEYQGQGYAITKYGSNAYYEIDGSYHEIPYQYLVWTKKGKEMILELYEMFE